MSSENPPVQRDPNNPSPFPPHQQPTDSVTAPVKPRPKRKRKTPPKLDLTSAEVDERIALIKSGHKID